MTQGRAVQNLIVNLVQRQPSLCESRICMKVASLQKASRQKQFGLVWHLQFKQALNKQFVQESRKQQNWMKDKSSS